MLLKWKPSDIKGHTDQTGIHLVWRVIFAEEFPKRLSFLNMASALGLSTVAGLIYLDAGFNDLSERKYGEKISLVFWQVAFWSVSTVYGAAVSYHSPRWFVFGGKMVHAFAELQLDEMQGKDETVHSEVTKPTGTLLEMPPGLEMIERAINEAEDRAFRHGLFEENSFPEAPAEASHYKLNLGQAVSSGGSLKNLSPQSPQSSRVSQSQREEAGITERGDLAEHTIARHEVDLVDLSMKSISSISKEHVAKKLAKAEEEEEAAISERANLPVTGREPTFTALPRSNPGAKAITEPVLEINGPTNRQPRFLSRQPRFKVKEPSVIATEIWKYHALRFVASLMLSSPWPMLYALVIDCFAALSPSVGSTILVGLTLVLTSQAFEAMGRMLSEFAGASGIAVAVTFASIFSQLLVIAGGFYKTVAFPLFAWMGHINAIKYGFSAVAKTYFKSTDSFWVTPPNAIAVRGYTWSSLEFMGAFTTLRTRGVTVVDSLNPPSIGFDITMLIVLCWFFRVICFGSALFRAHGGKFWKITRCLFKEEAKCPEENSREDSMREVSIADIALI